jgi:hypothetical protein
MDDGFRWWGVFLTAIGSATFAWHAIRGLRTGRASIPVKLFYDDVYQRGEAMFGLAIAFDILGTLGFGILAVLIGSGTL